MVHNVWCSIMSLVVGVAGHAWCISMCPFIGVVVHSWCVSMHIISYLVIDNSHCVELVSFLWGGCIPVLIESVIVVFRCWLDQWGWTICSQKLVPHALSQWVSLHSLLLLHITWMGVFQCYYVDVCVIIDDDMLMFIEWLCGCVCNC